MASNAISSNRLMAELIAARDQAEQHLEDPDNSRLSATGMLRQLTDAVSTFLGPVIDAMQEGAGPIDLKPVDQWGRRRCQEVHTYVDDPGMYQCAMVAGHAGECDPLPVEPESGEHEHHFPAGPVDEHGGSDPADCDVDGCGLSYDDYIVEITDPRL